MLIDDLYSVSESPAPTADGLRQQFDTIATGLRNQQALLSIRGLSLEPRVLATLQAIETELERLSGFITSDETELNQLRALTETSALMNSSLEVGGVLARAMDEIINLTGAERGFILLYDDAGELEFRVARTSEGEEDAAQEVSRTILNEVIATGAPLLTDNASMDERLANSETIARYTLRSVLCVPLVSKERTIGAVYVDNRYREAVFDRRELTVLTAFANQAAVAIENALLFTRVREALDETTRLKELIENVFASIASGVITTDAGEIVTTYNRAAAEILARPSESVLHQLFTNALPALGEEFENSLRQVYHHHQNVSLELTPTIPPRGRAILNLKLSPLRDAGQGTQGVAMVLDDLTAQRDRQQMLETADRYLPPGMIENIDQIASLALGGEKREVTCAFVYVCPYTLFDAGVPIAFMERLNAYLSVATGAIHRAGGVIDKYMGNEIMVLFNSQLNPQPDHAARAVAMALDVRRSFVKLYREQSMDEATHYYRIGIHSGEATLGNVGSSNRRNFTALGDTINLAKRLQENADDGQVLISEDTASQVAALQEGRLHELDAIQVKGRQQMTPVFEVTGG